MDAIPGEIGAIIGPYNRTPSGRRRSITVKASRRDSVTFDRWRGATKLMSPAPLRWQKLQIKRLRVWGGGCRTPNNVPTRLGPLATSQHGFFQAKVQCSKVLEGRNPRGTTLSEALRGNLPLRGVLRGLCATGGLFQGSAGLCRLLRASAGSTGFSAGSDPMLVMLANCWKVAG